MFKLVKIMSSGANVPEPIYVNFDGSCASVAGSVYYLTDGTISPTQDNGYEPLIYALQNLELEGDDIRALCYAITPDMIFEAEVSNSPKNLLTGKPFKLTFGGDGDACAISTDVSSPEEAVGTIININSYESTGKVLVRFFC